MIVLLQTRNYSFIHLCYVCSLSEDIKQLTVTRREETSRTGDDRMSRSMLERHFLSLLFISILFCHPFFLSIFLSVCVCVCHPVSRSSFFSLFLYLYSSSLSFFATLSLPPYPFQNLLPCSVGPSHVYLTL